MAGQVISIEKRSNRQGGLMSCAHGSGMATFDSTPDSLYKSCQYLKLSKSLKCHLKAGYSLLLLNEAKIVEWLAAGPPTVLQKCSSRMSAAGAYFFDFWKPKPLSSEYRSMKRMKRSHSPGDRMM